MISGFRPLPEVLGRDSSGSYIMWPTWHSMEAEIPCDEGLITTTIEILLQDRICLLCAPQAGRKTITAKLIGYRLYKKGWAVWYGEADHIDTAVASDMLMQLDKPKLLFIIDDCHKAQEEIDRFLRSTSALKSATVLLTSRPVVPVLGSSGMSALEYLFHQETTVSIEVTSELIRAIILHTFRDRGWHSSNAASLLTEDAINAIRRFVGDDLEILNWTLNSWDPAAGEPLHALTDRSHLFNSILKKRLSSAAARDVLLPLSSLYQFEAPVQSRFLPQIQDGLIENGVVLVNLPTPGAKGLFVRLAHPSLARLYLETAQWHDLLGKSIDDYTLSQLHLYFSSRPRNLYGVLRGLYNARRMDLITAAIENADFKTVVIAFVNETDLPLGQFAGLVGFVAKCDSALASVMFDNYISSRGSLQILNDYFALDERSQSLTNKHLSFVDRSYRALMFSSLPFDDLIDRIRSLDFDSVMSMLQLLKTRSERRHSEIVAVFKEIELDTIIEGVTSNLPISRLKFILSYCKSLELPKYRRIVEATIDAYNDKISQAWSWSRFCWFMSVLSHAGLDKRMRQLVEHKGTVRFVASAQTEPASQTITALTAIKKLDSTLSAELLRAIGLEWLAGDMPLSSAKTVLESLYLCNNYSLRDSILDRLTDTRLTRIIHISPPKRTIWLLQALLKFGTVPAKAAAARCAVLLSCEKHSIVSHLTTSECKTIGQSFADADMEAPDWLLNNLKTTKINKGIAS